MRVDFVKTDLEAAEIEAIEGAGSVLSVFKPQFAIASYHRRNGRPTANKLEQLIRESGYNSTNGFPEPHDDLRVSGHPRGKYRMKFFRGYVLSELRRQSWLLYKFGPNWS